MLYDNALLARAYLHGWQVTGEPLFRAVAEETLDWALREMRAPEGGFYSALDADSEGEEGKFYVWTLDELREALGDEPDADEAIAWFGATERGNFEGANILVRGPGAPERPATTGASASTRCARERVWPGLDDKRLTSWNALMISALAEAGAVLERADYLEAARGCARTSCWRAARRRRAACCAPGRTAAASSTPTSRTTPSCSRRCSPSTRRPSSRAGSPRRARWPTR